MIKKKQVDAIVEGASTSAARLLDLAQRFQREILIGVVLVLGISIFLLTYALRVHGNTVIPPSATSTPAVITGATSSRALDGMIVDASSTNLLPYAVMVENSADAWPLSGPAKANLVFEAPVEGGITRFLLVFDASSTVDRIGPVRSARPYYVDVAQGLNAVYAHVGGSPEALEKIKGLKGFRDLNEYWNGPSFWRSASRAAPHNVFIDTERLTAAANAKAWSGTAFHSWTYTDATSTRVDVGTVDVPYAGVYAASWTYSTDTQQYVRRQHGRVQQDADGVTVYASNVVLMYTDMTVLDDIGRLRIRTTGRGKATVYHHGQAHEGFWVRSTGDHIRFETIDGNDIPMKRGTTWVEMLSR